MAHNAVHLLPDSGVSIGIVLRSTKDCNMELPPSDWEKTPTRLGIPTWKVFPQPRVQHMMSRQHGCLQHQQ